MYNLHCTSHFYLILVGGCQARKFTSDFSFQTFKKLKSDDHTTFYQSDKKPTWTNSKLMMSSLDDLSLILGNLKKFRLAPSNQDFLDIEKQTYLKIYLEEQQIRLMTQKEQV